MIVFIYIIHLNKCFSYLQNSNLLCTLTKCQVKITKLTNKSPKFRSSFLKKVIKTITNLSYFKAQSHIYLHLWRKL